MPVDSVKHRAVERNAIKIPCPYPVAHKIDFFPNSPGTRPLAADNVSSDNVGLHDLLQEQSAPQ